jgi:hypothetical protein
MGPQPLSGMVGRPLNSSVRHRVDRGATLQR